MGDTITVVIRQDSTSSPAKHTVSRKNISHAVWRFAARISSTWMLMRTTIEPSSVATAT